MLFINNRLKYKFIINHCNDSNSIIDTNLYELLNKTKDNINNYKYNWDNNKKIINNYEFIYYSSNKLHNICSILPISRSFFKLQQILYDYTIINDKHIRCACIAEGPGGFIQSILYYCQVNDIIIDDIYGITLLDKTNYNIPYWNINIIQNKKIKLLSGEDNTGNLYNINNINNFIKSIDSKLDLVTCDGGIDYSDNYNSQELNSYKLLYSEIYLVLNIQKENGSCVIKFFDILHKKTIQLLFILTMVYDKIYIVKPTFSRKTNSEKYLICKHFKTNDDIIKKMKEYWDNVDDLSIDIPDKFLSKIKYFNKITINEQCSYINKILSINKNINIYPSKENIKNCNDWCRKYKLPIN